MSTVDPEIGEVAAMTAVRNNSYESIKPGLIACWPWPCS